jgi:uncharacterized membrane protein HdeD (DUF308 family)
MNSNLESNRSEAYWGWRRLHEHWLPFLILGIILILLGILALIGANVATLTSVIFFGILLTIGGILQLIYAFWEHRGRGFAQSLIAGIFATIAGILMWTHPTASALAITLLLAAFFTVSGIFKIIYSLSAPVLQWGWVLFSGIVSLILGIIIWSEWPTVALWLIGVLIGIDLIISGWLWLMVSLSARKLPEEQ